MLVFHEDLSEGFMWVVCEGTRIGVRPYHNTIHLATRSFCRLRCFMMNIFSLYQWFMIYLMQPFECMSYSLCECCIVHMSTIQSTWVLHSPYKCHTVHMSIVQSCTVHTSIAQLSMSCIVLYSSLRITQPYTIHKVLMSKWYLSLIYAI